MVIKDPNKLGHFLCLEPEREHENNVKVIYVWNILGVNKAAHGYGAKFSTKEK
ncbi:hypothetical protein [Proteiniborus ethanoligenes]|uniref:hypothetical protein n=1 Tax=Proteiniborus ethanoligenes TaxID=415015 RepID=UPI0015A2E605|nr:hypothetical protein [Proteiniborus ethanoligenes]